MYVFFFQFTREINRKAYLKKEMQTKFLVFNFSERTSSNYKIYAFFYILSLIFFLMLLILFFECIERKKDHSTHVPCKVSITSTRLQQQQIPILLEEVWLNAA